MVTGSQQYRIAEIAHREGLIDADFNFTEETKKSPIYAEFLKEWAKRPQKPADFSPKKIKKDISDTLNGVVPISYEDTFYPDGYRGLQTQYMAYMIYKKNYPDGEIKFPEFIKAYGKSQATMLSENNPAVAIMHKIYKDEFHKKPGLLMTESELREVDTELHTKRIKFGNEGLWVLSHYKKLTKENWIEVYSQGEGRSENKIIEAPLKEKSIETNEVLKIPVQQAHRFYNIIKTLPGNPWWAKYPEYIMSACFIKGLFNEEAKNKGDGEWIKKTEKFINETFAKNIPILQSRLATWNIKDPKVFVELATATSIMNVDEIMNGIELAGSPLNFLKTLESGHGPTGYRLSVYSESFERLMPRFKTKDEVTLDENEHLNEKEKRAAFAMKVFNIAMTEALERDLTLDFAIAATSQACVESSWGCEENEFDEPTLLGAGTNNIFGVKEKGDYFEYSELEYNNQIGDETFYIHHTKELNPKTNKLESCYAAFAKYDSIEDSVKGYFDLIESQYSLATEIGRSLPSSREPSKENLEEIFTGIQAGGYSTNPNYVKISLDVSQSVKRILSEYSVII